jgi:hypothetical protein
MHIGDMPVDKCAYSSRLFAEKVIPRLRDTWKGYEDRWSPHPLPASETVSPREFRARERINGNTKVGFDASQPFVVRPELATGWERPSPSVLAAAGG